MPLHLLGLRARSTTRRRLSISNGLSRTASRLEVANRSRSASVGVVMRTRRAEGDFTALICKRSGPFSPGIRKSLMTRSQARESANTRAPAASEAASTRTPITSRARDMNSRMRATASTMSTRMEPHPGDFSTPNQPPVSRRGRHRGSRPAAAPPRSGRPGGQRVLAWTSRNADGSPSTLDSRGCPAPDRTRTTGDRPRPGARRSRQKTRQHCGLSCNGFKVPALTGPAQATANLRC